MATISLGTSSSETTLPGAVHCKGSCSREILIGASVSEPHTSDVNAKFLCILIHEILHSSVKQ